MPAGGEHRGAVFTADQVVVFDSAEVVLELAAFLELDQKVPSLPVDQEDRLALGDL